MKIYILFWIFLSVECRGFKKDASGCSLPSDERFIYRDQNDMEISKESFIGNGETVTVSCATFDYFDFLTYDHDDDIKTEPTVTCIDGELSSLELDCPDVEPASCLELENGFVKKSLNLYFVSCDEGFSLNLIIPEMSECTCQNGELRSTIGNQIPKCIPNNCVLPYDADDKLSVKDRSRVWTIFAGFTIMSGDHVYLNCSKVTEGIYEPLNRRFKCVKGRWIEDEEDPKWVFGNDGEFPKCRKAICEPHCKNGGVCYKDDNCRCKHLTNGKRCEIVWCDQQCIQNGGKCVTPRKCSCPEERYGPYCEKNQCSVPEIENAVLERKSEKEYKHLDKIRLRCDGGHHFDGNNARVFVAVCQFGKWSRKLPVRCLPDYCELKIHEGSKFFLNGTLIENVRMFPHSSSVSLQCLDNFDTFDEKDNIVNATPRYPHMTCFQGNWKNVFQCKKRLVYFINVKTDLKGLKGAGPDANVYIYLHGQNGNTNKINLNGDFGNYDLDETRAEEKDIGPITSVTIGFGGKGVGVYWLIEFVSVHVEGKNESYVFHKHSSVWISESEDVVLTIKDKCYDTFDSGHIWYPKWYDLKLSNNLYNIGGNDKLSLLECQQKCTELKDFLCKSVYYETVFKSCWGISTAEERYFKKNEVYLYSVVYIRFCK